MEPLVLLLVGAVIAGPLIVASRGQRQAHRRELARALGLTIREGGLLGRDVLSGRIGRVPVRVEFITRGAGKSRTRWTRVVASGADPRVSFEHQGLGDDLVQAMTGQDPQVGDPAFDSAVLVRGEAPLLNALLDVETRRAVQRTTTFSHARVLAGEASFEERGHDLTTERISAMLGIVEDLARRLRPPTPQEIPARLAEIARKDPIPGVRRICLGLLERADPPVAAEVSRALCFHPDPTLRLHAARILGDLEAFRAASPAALRAYAPYDPDGLARALARIGDEAPLVALLEGTDTKVQFAVLHALARVGTVRAVEPILPLTRGLFGHDDVRSAARNAVASIQARAGGDGAGRVALVEDAGIGAVSVAGEAGAVSVPEERRKG
jgi:hypothetical protein